VKKTKEMRPVYLKKATAKIKLFINNKRIEQVMPMKYLEAGYLKMGTAKLTLRQGLL